MAATTTARKYNDPTWWNRDYDSGWDRVKEAFRRDWDQTKHDFGGDEPDLNQNVGDTVKQAAGREPIPPVNQPNTDEIESAGRFGYGARKYYGSSYREWNEDLESRLRNDWRSINADTADNWDRYRSAVRRGWEYDADRNW